MGVFSRFESKAENVVEGGGGLEPVKVAKRAAKEMQREKMVGVGHEYAPTLYNVLVSPEDDHRMEGYYPTLAGEVETYLQSAAAKQKLLFDCPPLVRFIVDSGLRRGRFDVIAENVSPSIIEDLRHEEMIHYGIEKEEPAPRRAAPVISSSKEFDPFTPADMQRATYVPEDAPAARRAHEPAAAAAGAAVAAGSAAAAASVASNAAPKPEAYEPVAPAMQGVATLHNVNTGRDHVLNGNPQSIGRSSSNDIVVRDSGASRNHAEILMDEGAWVIRDLGSTNGTYVNDAPITSCQLIDGDTISIGGTQLQFIGD